MIFVIGFLSLFGITSVAVAFGNAKARNTPAAIASLIVGAGALLLAWKLA